MKRNIKNEALKITGGQFKSWYRTLTSEDLKEYHYLLSNSRDQKKPFLKRPLVKLVFSLSIILSAIPSIYQDLTYGHDGTWTHYGMIAVGGLYLVESILWIMDVWDDR
tara:strand:- start:1113 stop:1436 length:324 start_codon:yes stop_codon:yes gene_type:complete